MLAPVPEKRKDGISSFSTLQKYLTTLVDPQTSEISERGQIMISSSLLSADTAALEMTAVAKMNPRCRDAVLHYILSWHEEETPSEEKWQQAVQYAMKELRDRRGASLRYHQYLAVAHNDTENFHVHVMVNRVHPETYRANAPAWLHRSLDKVCRELENQYGWKEDHGLYQWDKTQNKAVKTPGRVLEQWRQQQEGTGRTATGKTAKMEHYHDSETLETYCKAEPAKRLNFLMKQNKDTLSWQAIHTELARFGLILHKAEKGGFTVSDSEGEQHVKASKAFRTMFSGKQAQTWRKQMLGEFAPPALEIFSLSQNPFARYEKHASKRDPHMRQLRKEERRQVRQELLARYTEEKSVFEKGSLPRFEQNKRTFTALMKESAAILKNQKKQIRASHKSRDAKQIKTGIAIFEHEERCDELKTKIREAKAKSRFISRDEWIAQEAQKGDEAAIAYLRGQHYARQRKKKEEEREEDCSIRPQAEGQFDPKAQDFGNLKWVVDRETGVVEYRSRDRTMFVDTGPRIDIRVDASDEAILAALKLARSKYGKGIEATGAEDMLQRIAEVVVKNRLDIQFTDFYMQERVKEVRERMQAEVIRQKTKEAERRARQEAIPSKSVLDEEKEMQLLRELARVQMDNAEVKSAVSQNGTRTYGTVSGVTDRFVLQHIGKNEFRIHWKEHLNEKNIEVGQNLRIMYRDGKGIVEDRRQEKSAFRSR